MEYKKDESSNAYFVSAGEERERELDEFRRQWTAEVAARQRQQQETKQNGESKQLLQDSVNVTIDDTTNALQHLTLNEQSSSNATTTATATTTSPTMVTRTSINNNHEAVASSSPSLSPSSKVESPSLSALEHYKRAIRFETQNQLGDGKYVTYQCKLYYLY
jgi:hypothetical protein